MLLCFVLRNKQTSSPPHRTPHSSPLACRVHYGEEGCLQPHPERHVSATICFVHSPVRVRHVLSWYVGLEARCAHAMSALFLLCSPMSVGTSLPSHAAARLQAVFAVGCTHKERTTARARGCADSSKVKRAGRTVVILCVRARVLCACLFFLAPSLLACFPSPLRLRLCFRA